MAGTIYSKFFWQDWANDPGLGQCSFAAKGVWMDLLCLAAQSEPVGHVKLAGKVPTLAQLAHHLRSQTDVLEPLIEELLENAVCDRATSGALVSRRMVRDARKQRARASGGRVASGASVRNETGNFTSRSEVRRQPAPATINHQPESINHQPQKPPPETFEQKLGKVARLGEVLGFDPTTAKNGHRFIEDLVRLQADGFDFELDILPAIRAMRSEGRVPRDLGSLAYFRKPIEAAKTARQIVEAAGAQRIEAASAVSYEDWRKAMYRFLHDGAWIPPAVGPSPVENGCLAPPAMLEKARGVWNEQGQHPELDFFDKDRPWRSNALFEKAAPFWGDNVVTMPRRTG